MTSAAQDITSSTDASRVNEAHTDGSPVKGSPAEVPGIEAKNITVTYRNGHTALRDASFSIPNATICALVGVNGSGKSTLFKAIMGFVPVSYTHLTLPTKA